MLPAVDTLAIDAESKPYGKVSGVSGTINSIGSDTLNNLITLWAEGFRKQYPNVKIQAEGKDRAALRVDRKYGSIGPHVTDDEVQ